MARLPVIVGFGGINSAGRTSSHQAYRRIVFDLLPSSIQQDVLLDLATITNMAEHKNGLWYTNGGEALDAAALVDSIGESLLARTLIRRIHPSLFDVDHVVLHKSTTLQSSQSEEKLSFTIKTRSLPNDRPTNWQVTELSDTLSEVVVDGNLETFIKDTRPLSVKAAGQLPTGFDPSKLYQSRNHPRGLQMTVYGASDAVKSSGIDWEIIRSKVAPDQMAVYAANSIGQMDDLGFGGMLKSALMGKRTTSKHLPLGYAQMPADFVNAYILGSVGNVGTAIGACATYFFNLEKAIEGIKTGKFRVAMVGGSDAPITPEIIEGFRTMGALAEDTALLALDEITNQEEPDHTRSCRPFAQNCGFTIGESSQWTLLMDDELAIELGAEIFGSIPAVFSHADGHKKSISAPGIGNYLTMSKAMAYLQNIIGNDGLTQRTFIQAHGTSTPQNRITESHVLSKAATSFGATEIPVVAMKAFLGHSQGTAGGDQLHLSLGVWKDGILPGITTSYAVADDVYQDGLKFQLKHEAYGKDYFDAALLNSKGFGGNNATAVLLSPIQTMKMLSKRYSTEQINAYQAKNIEVAAAAEEYNQSAIRGETLPIYKFGFNVLGGEELSITDQEIRLPGYDMPVNLNIENEFSDLK
ncbi:MAG: beta-ketoacyl synthase [Gammaproteobacteria bacterium]|uniref:beta-ketoacyl synthase n=1 Tax=unclassified Marinomonas TaxID=196814 RepID=UPI000C1DD041|nr:MULTISPECIES: beta-ketoacyl synthase [unclassified Marinomonas]MBU2021479.1 beta-ketoacyl synthase [Gammaproteobacteria bacterium]MBU2240338.1 beta-ketoacyl synthase [Gammaproteobacteria bacterium]MBU2414051.1 beta-ketoacyl synthase [Gammaproteobacteria bacterium]PJE54333.1 beta-ketoacyl synthase [Marinomonas sp. BSi20584]